MSIYISIEDKEGEQLSRAFDIERVQRYFPSMPDSVCLRYISDDYDTAFNPLQIPLLREELEQAREQVISEEEQAELEQLIQAVKTAAGKKGAYVKFYGERYSE